MPDSFLLATTFASAQNSISKMKSSLKCSDFMNKRNVGMFQFKSKLIKGSSGYISALWAKSKVKHVSSKILCNKGSYRSRLVQVWPSPGCLLTRSRNARWDLMVMSLRLSCRVLRPDLFALWGNKFRYSGKQIVFHIWNKITKFKTVIYNAFELQ